MKPISGASREHAPVGQASPQRRWSLFALLLVAMLGGAAILVVSPAAALVQDLALTDHVGAVCLLFLSAILTPLHRVFEVALAAGLVFAVRDRYKAWQSARDLVLSVVAGAPPQNGRLAKAAKAAGIRSGTLVRLEESPVPAFTVGALRPQIFVSARLEDVLNHDELVAVLAHENEHVLRRDPLRLSVMRFLSRSLFWLPAVRVLEEHLAEEAEYRADAAASRVSGIATASALLELVRHFGRSPMPALSTGLSHHDFLASRIRLITGENVATHTRVRGSTLLVSAAALLLLWAAALAEVYDGAHSGHLASSHAECAPEQPVLGGLICVSPASDVGTEKGGRGALSLR